MPSAAAVRVCTCSIYVKKLSCVQYDIYVRPVSFLKKKALVLQKSFEVQYFAILRYRVNKCDFRVKSTKSTCG